MYSWTNGKVLVKHGDQWRPTNALLDAKGKGLVVGGHNVSTDVEVALVPDDLTGLLESRPLAELLDAWGYTVEVLTEDRQPIDFDSLAKPPEGKAAPEREKQPSADRGEQP